MHDADRELLQLEHEWWFARMLGARVTGDRFNADIFAGDTDRARRAARARALILEHDLAATRVFATKPDTFGELHRRLYEGRL